MATPSRYGAARRCRGHRSARVGGRAETVGIAISTASQRDQPLFFRLLTFARFPQFRVPKKTARGDCGGSTNWALSRGGRGTAGPFELTCALPLVLRTSFTKLSDMPRVAAPAEDGSPWHSMYPLVHINSPEAVWVSPRSRPLNFASTFKVRADFQ